MTVTFVPYEPNRIYESYVRFEEITKEHPDHVVEEVRNILGVLTGWNIFPNSMVETVRHFSTTINQPRTPRHALNHLKGEVEELDEELALVEAGKEPGEDGIVGEAMDIIQCALDIVFQRYPDITEAELASVQRRKGEKWVSKYGIK